MWFGKPNVFNEFKNYGVMPSYGSSSMLSDVLIEYELRYFVCSPDCHDGDDVISKV